MTDPSTFSARLDEAVRLARRGAGEVEPNPPVGAVVIRDGEVVGRGWHGWYGGPHAEVAALAEAGDRSRGATLVVTLEPCSTTGKTPPCVDATVAAGIARVVVGATDPNPRHAGRGMSLLRESGVEVVGPVAHPASEGLLARFRRHLDSGRAFVIAKWAATLDGRIATRGGESRWISGEESRARVHELRGRVDAIAVGRGTVDADDPSLTARPPGARVPRRVVFDRRLRLRDDWRALSDGGPEVLLVHGPEAPADRRAALAARGATLVEVSGDAPAAVAAAVGVLRERGVERLLVEGGPTLLGAFLDAEVVDRVAVFVAPKVFGGDAPGAVGGAGILRIADGPAFEDGAWSVRGEDAVYEGFVASRAR
ncbi:MAG: bifunctional diaminohydroxyphosphoribosylaminopyrimidine deaminase/5-amino-6-(5-phosphoribosylamino)uracil reductase RibD [Planctomycetota bacterium JB042]